jgi:hypothetical protein
MTADPWVDQESAYLTALQAARSFRFDSQGRLEIVYSDPSEPDQVLIYTSSERPLTGTNWILISYGDPASRQPAPTESVITAVFSPEGFVSGFSGCNEYNASYTLQEQQITSSLHHSNDAPGWKQSRLPASCNRPEIASLVRPLLLPITRMLL